MTTRSPRRREPRFRSAASAIRRAGCRPPEPRWSSSPAQRGPASASWWRSWPRSKPRSGRRARLQVPVRSAVPGCEPVAPSSSPALRSWSPDRRPGSASATRRPWAPTSPQRSSPQESYQESAPRALQSLRARQSLRAPQSLWALASLRALQSLRALAPLRAPGPRPTSSSGSPGRYAGRPGPGRFPRSARSGRSPLPIRARPPPCGYDKSAAVHSPFDSSAIRSRLPRRRSKTSSCRGTLSTAIARRSGSLHLTFPVLTTVKTAVATVGSTPYPAPAPVQR